jgi:hypothetical protein
MGKYSFGGKVISGPERIVSKVFLKSERRATTAPYGCLRKGRPYRDYVGAGLCPRPKRIYLKISRSLYEGKIPFM